MYSEHFIQFLREQNDVADEEDSPSDLTLTEENRQNKSGCQEGIGSETAEHELKPQQKRSKMVVELTDHSGISKGKQYRFKAVFIARNFKGQKQGDHVGELQIMADSVDAVLADVWNFASRFIHREVFFQHPQSESTSSDLEVRVKDTEPVIADIDKFVLFSDKISKRYYVPSSIKSNLLHNWFCKDVIIYLYRYSLAVTSSQQWDKVKLSQSRPSHVDRSGAPSNVLLAEMCAELKSIHKEHYVSDDINWSIWATYVLKQPAHLRSQLMSGGPPESMVRLFRPKPLHPETVLQQTKQELKIASNVVNFFSDEIKDMRGCFRNLEETVQQLGSRISVMERKVDEYRGLLTSMSETVTPQESAFSKAVAEEVPDCFDVDHS